MVSISCRCADINWTQSKENRRQEYRTVFCCERVKLFSIVLLCGAVLKSAASHSWHSSLPHCNKDLPVRGHIKTNLWGGGSGRANSAAVLYQMQDLCYIVQPGAWLFSQFPFMPQHQSTLLPKALWAAQSKNYGYQIFACYIFLA